MSLARKFAVLATLMALLAGLTVVAGGEVASASPSAPAAAKTGSEAARTPPVVGQPPRNYVIPAGSYFSFPNKRKADKLAIRNRVLSTINSVWGGHGDAHGLPQPGNGRIRIATWSFNDMAIAKALVAAKKRGVSVQVLAAASANKSHHPWQWLKKKLGQSYYRNGVAGSTNSVSFARQCKGSCRGHGGTPHSKYFLFANVGFSHVRTVTVQTSMNLTRMGYEGQWNQAQVWTSPYIYQEFNGIFGQSRVGRYVANPYRRYAYKNTVTTFFPRPGTSPAGDPVMAALNGVHCTGSTVPGSKGRTKIRIIQYAIYDRRGEWIAKRLRSLWNAGCNIAVIYSVSTRPVLQILRSGSGRGPIPMKQSVITNSAREIVKYNHSKWMTITGNFGGHTANYLTFDGSANWSNAAFSNDEQMQQVIASSTALAHINNFNQTWVQSSSHSPGYGIKASEGRVLPLPPSRLMPNGSKVPWGKGAFKFMSPNGG